MFDSTYIETHLFKFDVFKDEGKKGSFIHRCFLISQIRLMHSKFVPLFTFYLSTETPKLPQRIIDAMKSYIYTPEEGKRVVCVMSGHAFKCYVLLHFYNYFSFPQPSGFH